MTHDNQYNQYRIYRIHNSDDASIFFFLSSSLWGRLTVAATVVALAMKPQFGYDDLNEEQQLAVDQVKEQMMALLPGSVKKGM